MQKIVKNTVLIEKDELLFEGNDLFSGIVFFKANNGFLTANYVDHGMISDNYIPFCLPDNIDRNVKIIDVDNIDFDGERATINNGEIYSGIAIDFNQNGYSYLEEYFDEDGMRSSDISWDKDMSVKSFSLDHGVIYENGEMHNENLIRYNLWHYFFIKFNGKGKLSFIDISKDFFSLKLDVLKLLVFFLIIKISDIYNWDFSEELSLAGGYIDSNYILEAFQNGKLNIVRKINFYETNVNDYSFILKLNKIEEINISTNSSSLMSDEERIYNENNNGFLKKTFSWNSGRN